MVNRCSEVTTQWFVSLVTASGLIPCISNSDNRGREITVVRSCDMRTGCKGNSWFDVPPTNYGRGVQTGLICALTRTIQLIQCYDPEGLSNLILSNRGRSTFHSKIVKLNQITQETNLRKTKSLYENLFHGRYSLFPKVTNFCVYVIATVRMELLKRYTHPHVIDTAPSVYIQMHQI